MTPRWTYTLFMLLAVAVFLLVRHAVGHAGGRRCPPLRKRAALGLAAFVGAAFGSKVPFVLDGGAWLVDGKTITTGLAGAYLAVELTKWALGIRVKTGDAFCAAAGPGGGRRPPGLLLQRLLPRHRHYAAVGRRLRRRRPPPSDAALRNILPPRDGGGALGPQRPATPCATSASSCT